MINDAGKYRVKDADSVKVSRAISMRAGFFMKARLS
jgi:hypothetical protein